MIVSSESCRSWGLCTSTQCEHALWGVRSDATKEEKWTWQPWLCAPLFMASTNHTHLLVGLAKVMPWIWHDGSSIRKFCNGSSMTMASLCFDFASSNVRSFAQMLGLLKSIGCNHFLLHGERCLVHQLHIVKSACLSASKAASMLYSLSQILPKNHSASGLSDCMKDIVKKKLVVRFRHPPPGHAASMTEA